MPLLLFYNKEIVLSKISYQNVLTTVSLLILKFPDNANRFYVNITTKPQISIYVSFPVGRVLRHAGKDAGKIPSIIQMIF